MGYKEERRRELARAAAAGIEPAPEIKEKTARDIINRQRDITAAHGPDNLQVNPELREKALEELSEDEEPQTDTDTGMDTRSELERDLDKKGLKPGPMSRESDSGNAARKFSNARQKVKAEGT